MKRLLIGLTVAMGLPAWAQQKQATAPAVKDINFSALESYMFAPVQGQSYLRSTATCEDTSQWHNYDATPIDSPRIFFSTWGFVSGHNNYSDSMKLELFHLKALGMDSLKVQAINIAIVWLANAAADATPEVEVVIYGGGGPSGAPLYQKAIDLNNPPAGTGLIPLGTAVYLLSDSANYLIDVTAGHDSVWVGLIFHYTPVDVNQDTVGIFQTKPGDQPTGDNTAYEVWNDGTVITIAKAWGGIIDSMNLYVALSGVAYGTQQSVQYTGVAPETVCPNYTHNVTMQGVQNAYAIYYLVREGGNWDTTLSTALDFEPWRVTFDNNGTGDTIIAVAQGLCGQVVGIQTPCTLDPTSISVTPDSACVNQQATFTVSANCANATLVWTGSLSDSGSITGGTYSHTYTAAGTDTVTITAQGDDGCSVSANFTIQVKSCVTGVTEALIEGVQVYVQGHNLYIRTSQPVIVRLTTVDGKVIDARSVQDETIMSLPVVQTYLLTITGKDGQVATYQITLQQ